MKSEELNYKIDEQIYKSFVAYPESSDAPLILIVHTWAGRDKFVEEKAKKLASEGYVAMAVDMYGDGKVGNSNEENQSMMQPLLDDRKNLSQVVIGAYEAAKKLEEVEIKERKRPKYTPLSKRQDRPDAILWLCKNASELTDGQISKLVGSTKGTVSLIRKRSYWNFSNLKPRDPVILALCTQEAFQKALDKAKRRVEREKKAKIREEKKAQAASL